ncbi:MAG: hypothetical protein OXU86_06725 [Thaumarchaeota archaeon]|nr:hypothetical protein [Nitrososphaerota archaeon]MDD9843364.1 hypothetical protein [Nitrososphaerota archaeon]
MERAVTEEGGQMRVRPELMEDDRMYHCIVGGRLMLVYRDAQGVTHCYEVEDEAVVGAVRSCATYGEAERLLEGLGAGGMNRVINQQDPRGATMSAESDAARVYSEYTSSSDGSASQPQGGEAAPGGSCGCGGEAGSCDDKAGEINPSGHDAPQGGGEPGHGGGHDAPPDRDAPQGGGDQGSAGHDGGERRTDGHGAPPDRDAPQGGGEQRQGGRPEGEQRDRSVVLIGIKPIMTYVTATLTQLATLPKITIKARGKRITQAVDVSQMIVKRMNTVGYEISDVRIASDSFTGEDGKNRKISTMEIDIIKKP